MKPGVCAALVVALAGLPAGSRAFDGLTLHVSRWLRPTCPSVRASSAIPRIAGSRLRLVALDGERAPSPTEIAFKGLPGGEHGVWVVRHRTRGVKGTATRPLAVVETSADR